MCCSSLTTSSGSIPPLAPPKPLARFTQAGSEVSALLGRIPSAVGYQPTLATDMGTMQERITTTKKGSITSVQVCIRRLVLFLLHYLCCLYYYFSLY